MQVLPTDMNPIESRVINRKHHRKYTPEEKKAYLDEAIRNGGYYGDDGCWNSIMVFTDDDHIYRGRVETLIIRDDKYIFLRFLPREEQTAKRSYLVPGGSFDRDVPNMDQALNECREEARINVKNIKSTGIIYKEHKDPPKWAIDKQAVNWNGNYTEVYVGEYDGKYTGHIDKVDEDKFMAKGHFYRLDEIYPHLKYEHKKALQVIYPNRFPKLKDKVVTESMIRTKPDIYYNKEKFDSGEINLCFVTGHCGSGKSTMGRDMESKEKIKHYELDIVIDNKYNYTMENLKEEGDMTYSFFKGPGKKYYYIEEDLKAGTAKHIEDYDRKLINDYIKYAISYAKSHPNQKFVVEGVQLYLFIEPSVLKDYAVYIKGTSRITSDYRASKRNYFSDFGKEAPKGKVIKDTLKNTFTIRAVKAEMLLKKYRNYFSKKSKEDVVTESGNDIKYKQVPLSKSVIDTYSKKDSGKFLSHFRCTQKTKGVVYLDNDNVIGAVNIEEKEDGKIWIQALEVNKPYQGKGFGYKLLKEAIQRGATELSVRKTNINAIRLYIRNGFKCYKETENQYFMSTKKREKVINIENNIITESTNENTFYFYHLIPKDSDISNGITSLEYQYKNDIEAFRKNSYKYRKRLCDGWNIYPGRNPDALSDDEVHYGINKFRKSIQGCNQIYLFRFPPHNKLGKEMAEILKYKDIYRVDLDELRRNKIVVDVDFGYVDSNTDNEKLTEDWYRMVSPNEYFSKYTETNPNRLLFSYMNHISVVPKNGYIPKRFLTKVVSPEKISEIIQVPKSTVLYHGSPVQGLKYIEPRKCKGPIGEKTLVYTTQDIRFAACFGGRWRDNVAKQGSWDHWKTIVMGISNQVDLNSPCSIYEVYNDGSFILVGKHKRECVSKNKIRIKKEIKFNSWKEALETYGVKIVSYDEYEQAVKRGYLESTIRTESSLITEKALTSKERNEIPSSKFGIPSQRRFPLHDKEHVLAAIRMFNRVDWKHEKELAHNIILAMKRYDISPDVVGKLNRLKTYL